MKYTRIVSSFCVLWAILLAHSRAAMAQAGGGPQTHVVRIGAAELPALDGLGLTPLRDLRYGSFAWLQLSAEDFALLQSSGLPYQERKEPYTLHLGGQRFDPLGGVPPLPT